LIEVILVTLKSYLKKRPNVSSKFIQTISSNEKCQKQTKFAFERLWVRSPFGMTFEQSENGNQPPENGDGKFPWLAILIGGLIIVGLATATQTPQQ